MEFEKNVKIRREKFGTVIFQTLCEKVFVTNQTGSAILQMIEEEKDLDNIVAELAQNFESDFEIVAKDVTEFIMELKENQIIRGVAE